MSITDRTRSITGTALKAQRRIALTQALFWPIVLIIAVVIGAVALLSIRRRHRPAPPATGTQVFDESR